jgi:hypothetical protein
MRRARGLDDMVNDVDTLEFAATVSDSLDQRLVSVPLFDAMNLDSTVINGLFSEAVDNAIKRRRQTALGVAYKDRVSLWLHKIPKDFDFVWESKRMATL